MNKVDKRKVLGTIIGGIFFLTCILFFTYAYYNWRSENTAFSFEIQEASVICENGPDVNVSNIGPVLDYNDGVSATFKVQNSGEEATTFTLSLDITSISNTLLVESFKYILLKGNVLGTNFSETGISGNFSTFQVGSNTISNTVAVDGNSGNTFKFIVYIDGSMYNNPNMMESSMNSSLVIGDCDSIGTVDTTLYLNSVEPGSYVAYTGTNGCPDGHCDGTNANYVSDTNMGYCNSSSYKFSVNGWRIGYIQNDTAYLVSAGAPECLATYIDSRSSSTSNETLSTDYYYGSGYTFDSNTGTFSLTGVTSSTLAWSSNYESIIANTPYTCKKTSSTATCTTLYEVTAYSSSTKGVTYPHYNYEVTGGAPQHLANLDSKALTYCNPSYAFGGACDSNSAWAMDAIDFEAITGSALSPSSCYVSDSDTLCGYGNDLIDNGGYYWYATAFNRSSTYTFYWHSYRRNVSYNGSNSVFGVRPVLRLASSVQVVGGSGTYEDPYQIENPKYLSDVEPGSYVAYTGTNGCPDGHCDGTNANYVSDTDMGYCASSSYKFSVNGWRIGYIQNDTAYLVSAGAPECLATYIDSRSSSTSTQTLSTDYYYGSGYTFDSNTGKFSLTGVTSSTLAWSSNYESIIANTPYTCKRTSSTATCTNLYEVTAYSSSTKGVTYPHDNCERTGGVPQHLANLDSKALTYCNPSYAFGGACDSNSAWAMDAIDFEAITGSTLSMDSCYNVSDSTECGYGNDLIDNGGYYWYATAYRSSSTAAFYWYPSDRHVIAGISSYNVHGVRPVLRLASSVQVVGGSGTYADPYQISP